MSKVSHAQTDVPVQLGIYNVITLQDVDATIDGNRLEIRIPAQSIPDSLIVTLESLGLRPSQVEETIRTIQDNLTCNYLLSRRVDK